MSILFISHSSHDSAAAQELQLRLQEQGHRSVFLDLDPEKGIQAGVSWERTLYTKLRACRAVVALCSDSYLASQWCFAEIALARMEGKELFVLQINPWSEETQMPSILTEEQFIDLRIKKDDGYQRLWNGFKVKGIVPAEARDWKPEEPPYPGLRAFREEDAPIFFGRDEEVRAGSELLNRVRRQGHPRLVMVLGSSGSGKSSLVRAGIVPQLRRDRPQWLVVKPFRPGPQPARKLAASLGQAFEDTGHILGCEEIYHWLQPGVPALEPLGAADTEPTLSVEAGPTPSAARDRLLQALSAMEGELTAADDTVARSVRQLKDYINEKRTATPLSLGALPPESVSSPLAELTSRLQLQSEFPEATVVLVIDQFEELLGHEGDHPSTRFLMMLRVAMEAEDSPLLVIGTMRSDYLGLLQRSPALRGIGFKSLSVGPMSKEGMRQIIEEPAKLGQIQLENGLSDLLLEDTETSDALPLLAFTLRAMWDRFRDDRLLDIREYKAFGGLHGGIAQVADETYQDAIEQIQDQSSREAMARELRDAFLSMARPGAEGSGWARRPVAWDRLGQKVRPVIERFIDPQRLLVKRQDGTVEVAHEALFRSWARLKGWLDENAEGLHLLGEIQIEAKKWNEASTKEEKEPYLWRGGRLSRAVELRDDGVLPLKDLDNSFIEASDQAEKAQLEAESARQRRELRRTRFAAVLISIFLVAAIWSYWQVRLLARQSLSRQLAAQSSQFLNTQLDVALLLALAAGQVENTLDAQSALLAAVQHNPRLWRYHHGPGDPIHSVTISADGKVLAAAVQARDDAKESSVLLWGVDDGLPLATSPLYLAEINDPVAAFSPDGRWLAVGGVDRQNMATGHIKLWDMAVDPPQPRDVPAFEGIVNDLHFCGQQQSTLVWATKSQVFVWRPDEDTKTSLLASEADIRIRRLAFAADCSCLAVGHEDKGQIDFIDLGSARVGMGKSPATQQRASTVCPKKTLRGPKSEDRVRASQGIISLAFAPSGDTVAAARVDGTVDVWDLTSLSSETLTERAGVDAVAYQSDRTLLTAGRDGAISLWDISESPAASVRLPGHAGRVTGLANGGGDLFASGGEDGKAILWKLDRTQRLATILKGHHDEVLAVTFDPAGRRLLSGGVDETVKLWDLDNGEYTELPGATGVTPGVDFSSDGMLAAAGGEDGSLHLWHLGDEKKNQHWFSEGAQPVFGIRFSPVGSTLATAVKNKIVLWDFGAAPPVQKSVPKLNRDTPPADIWQLLYRDGGGSIVTSHTGGPIRVWNLETGRDRQLDPFVPDGGTEKPILTPIAQSADGKLLAAGGDDNCVHLWHMSKNETSFCLKGHELEVFAVAFGPGDRAIISADKGGNLLVWDVASMNRVGRLRDGHGPGEPINSLAVSGKTAILASAADDYTIAIWNLNWKTVACDVARRGMNAEEWQKYLGDSALSQLCPIFEHKLRRSE